MSALRRVIDWPVEFAAAAVIARPSRALPGTRPTVVDSIGDVDRVVRLASLSKCMTAWAAMVAWEERTVELDEPVEVPNGHPGTTLRHLLSHAAGFAFDGDRPVAGIETRRIYSNTGIEHVADLVASAAGMPFGDYLDEAVFQPLAMRSTELRGSAAHSVWSTTGDVAAFVAEMLAPTLLAPATAHDVWAIQYPDLAGIVPGVGSFNPCPWGLGVEIKGGKSPHWTGRATSPATFGHFGGAGTMMWADQHHGVGLVALTDRPFDEWAADALRLWPALSDAVVAEHGAAR